MANIRLLVELKNGETYNGRLVNCDTWMNIHLREVICTSKDGDRFWRMPECYIRGNTIKYLRVPDEGVEEEEVERMVQDVAWRMEAPEVEVEVEAGVDLEEGLVEIENNDVDTIQYLDCFADLVTGGGRGR
ncbi:hypothetical protein DH2020_013831 [Rehmannia glutinosa]|uniref:U6 snRNA-associated Sm-like protein LSm4 n=1 Tax=Rehmannia glutinosa TaxID=99300 RepID=A0ABR0X3E8_REHGL